MEGEEGPGQVAVTAKGQGHKRHTRCLDIFSADVLRRGFSQPGHKLV